MPPAPDAPQLDAAHASAAAHVDVPSAAEAPPPSSPARSTPGWIEIGASVMVLPLTLAIMAMLAPVLWLAGSRPRR